MYSTLNVSREVKVYIGGFISVEAKEGLKGNVVSVCIKLCAALGTGLIGQVKSRTDATVGKEFGILTFGAIIDKFFLKL